MEKRVELEMRGKQANEVYELNLDNCRATQITGITDEFTKLEYLSLINVGLTTLKGFPTLHSLKRLDLSDNRLTSGLDNLYGAENLTHLNLSGNKIKDLQAIEALTKFSKLKSLDMFNCDLTSSENYREKVFELLPTLKYLDGFDKDDKECDDSDDNLDEDEIENDDEDGDDAEDDDEECGLEYLQSSRAAQDEDETEDFEPGAEGEHEDEDDEDDIDEEEEESSGKGTKRKLEDDASN